MEHAITRPRSGSVACFPFPTAPDGGGRWIVSATRKQMVRCAATALKDRAKLQRGKSELSVGLSEKRAMILVHLVPIHVPGFHHVRQLSALCWTERQASAGQLFCSLAARVAAGDFNETQSGKKSVTSQRARLQEAGAFLGSFAKEITNNLRVSSAPRLPGSSMKR